MDLAITIIMIVGAVLIAIFSLPNLIYVIKTKNTSGVNLWMYLIFMLSCAFFSVYGLGITLDHDNFKSGLPILISNSLCVLIACITLIYKFINLRQAKLNNLTEFEYWKKYHGK